MQKLPSQLSLCFLLFVVGTSGCSSVKVQTNNCKPELENEIRSSFDFATASIQQCLKKYDRKDDLKLYNLLLQKRINVTCDPNEKVGVLALAGSKDSLLFPEMKIYSAKFEIPSKYSSLRNTLAHESLHWLGYEHYTGYDLAYISEMCCMEHNDKFLNEIGRESCKLFDYKNEQWLDSNYIIKLTKYLGYFGRSFVGLRTSLNAAIQAQKLKYSREKIFEILEKTSLEISDGAYVENISSDSYEYYSKSVDITQTLVISYITNKSDSAYAIKLRERFFKNKHRKLKLYELFALTLKNLIFEEYTKITKSWLDFKYMEKTACPDLSKNEVDALKELALDTHFYLYSEKNKINDYNGKKSSMLSEWSDICSYKK